MLTKGDDFPIHQTPEPVAVAGTDRNFYDRYFFNGYSPDGSRFFAAALGVYPHLNIIDAAFCWMEGGVQRSAFASRFLNHERMDTQVGPIRVEILEPLRRIRVVLETSDGIAADLVFDGRHHPIVEPRFIRRVGSRTLMDVTRMTVNGSWSGSVTVDGTAIGVEGWQGTRDRSWGVRPIGAQDAQPMAPAVLPQFYWLWAPINFPRHCLYFHTNDEADGSPWNRSAVLVDLQSGAETRLGQPAAKLSFKPGTRHAAAARLTGRVAGGEVSVELTPGATFFMHGIGYGHPTRSHGSFNGSLSVVDERFDSAGADEGSMLNNHIQALVAARLTLPDGTVEEGRGILEQMIMGPHDPSGFKDLFDLA